MTSHLEEGVLQELLDGEIPSSELPPIQAHLAGCAECRTRLEEARAIDAEADRLIEAIDLPPAARPAATRLPPVRRRRWVRNLAWAATVIIAAGLGYRARDMGEARLADRRVAAEPAPAPLNAPAPPAQAKAAPLREQPQAAPRAQSRRSEPGATRDQAAGARIGDRAAGAAAGAPEERTKAEEKPAVTASLRKAVIDSGPATGVAAPPAASPPKQAAVPAPSPLSAGNLMRRLDELSTGGAARTAISFEEAETRLNGSLRLIDGLIPLRFEASGDDVRVVYRLGTGELVLVERLDKGAVTYRLVAPANFPADSLERLRARVHD